MRPSLCRILGVLLLVAQSASAQGGDPARIAFVSDTQDPTWVEPLVLKVTRNALARDMIFQDILDSGPGAVVHLGDMVSSGSNGEAWRAIDTFVASLHAAGILFHPIPGNHEYFVFAGSGRRNYEIRFPDATASGYVVHQASLAVVLLNSNRLQLTDEEQRDQVTWYRDVLQRLDADSSVHFIIVGTHHSPYTNSTIVAPSSEVETIFVPPFLAARKTVLFVSGHAHAFEHYRRGGKNLLVIGGGGGLLQPLLTGSRRRYDDLYGAGGITRMFHYLLCDVEPWRMRLDVRMIRDDFSGFDSATSFEFEWRPRQASAGGQRKTPSP